MKLFTAEAQRRREVEKCKGCEGGARTRFPLPSTGRGIEGEGWLVSRRSFPKKRALSASPLTPALSPLRGGGEAIRVRLWCFVFSVFFRGEQFV